MSDRDLNVTGTLVWYYYICKREVWLMARQIAPDQDDENIDFGRYLHEKSYQRDKKEISIGNIKLDIIRKAGDQIVVGEVKKSSKYKESATMQLAFYLSELKVAGIEAVGELLFPLEKKKIKVELTEEMEAKIDQVKNDILKLIYVDKPPLPKKINFCRNCAYSEFCWA